MCNYIFRIASILINFLKKKNTRNDSFIVEEKQMKENALVM